MYIIEVMALKRGLGKDSLTYFSKYKIKEGSMIKVPIRSKFVSAIVLSVSAASTKKAELKLSPFALKKIKLFDNGSVRSAKEGRHFFDEWWIKAIQKIGYYFGYAPGSIMSVFTPAVLIHNFHRFDNAAKNNEKLLKRKNGRTTQNIGSEQVKTEILCTQTETEERWGYYRSAIREEFAKKHSVFLCLPTQEDIKVAVANFKKGIERYTYTFHSGDTKSELIEKWNKCVDEEHPVLIIATAQWLLMPRLDLGTIILDKENSSGWKTLGRPYIDIRKSIEFFAKERGARLILGDSMLQIETIWRYKNDEIFPFEPVKFRLTSSAATEIISMTKASSFGRSRFKVISPELALLLRRAEEEKKNIFIYVTRRGLSPITLCSDCGEEVFCHNCSSPMVLYKASAEKMPISAKDGHLLGNTFRCHQCGSARSAKELCKKCGSWRLMPLGVGIERVEEEIQKIIKKENSSVDSAKSILLINSDTTTRAKASQIAEKFYKTPGSILIGTEMALHYLNKAIDFTAVASIEALFSIPDYKIREKIFHTVLTMKLISREKCLVQIRNAEKTAIELALSGNLLDFYKLEIEERELLQYPPFSIFIKMTVRGSRAFAEKECNFLELFFKEWSPIIYESRFERRDSPSAYNCVIKIPREKWFNRLTINEKEEELISKILSLPPHFEIKVDPDNLL